jgi:hypothetical protein
MAGVVENFAGEIICNEIKGEKPVDTQVGQREVWGIESVLELDCVIYCRRDPSGQNWKEKKHKCFSLGAGLERNMTVKNY